MEEQYLVQAENIQQYFRITDQYTVKAVDGVSFGIKQGEVFGLVGETGCGKSTIARMLTGIYKPTGGLVRYRGEIVSGKEASTAMRKLMQSQVQMIFQDSAAALNPRMTVEKLITEPLRIQGRINDKANIRTQIIQMLENTGLDETYLKKYPGELSGGQRQRVAIARSLMLNPSLMIADEPVASMDISIQAQIITLFQNLQEERHFSMLFIAHDLAVVRFISDRIGVMLAGKLVELAPTEELFAHPMHPYTQALLSAIHVPDPIYERNKVIREYDHQSALGSEFVEVSPEHYVLK